MCTTDGALSGRANKINIMVIVKVLHKKAVQLDLASIGPFLNMLVNKLQINEFTQHSS